MDSFCWFVCVENKMNSVCSEFRRISIRPGRPIYSSSEPNRFSALARYTTQQLATLKHVYTRQDHKSANVKCTLLNPYEYCYVDKVIEIEQLKLIPFLSSEIVASIYDNTSLSCRSGPDFQEFGTQFLLR